jgi:hypothetical protein
MKRTSALLIFAIVACVGSTTSVAASNKIKDSGSIAGVIHYPGKQIPSMRVCAFNTETKATSCIKTKEGQTNYFIKSLPVAEYYILADIAQGELKVGGHMLQVQCIRAPCPALLKSLKLKARQKMVGVDLNNFYQSREDFPLLPKAETKL